MPDWLLFLITATLIAVAGSALALFADVLAARTGLGALWFGAVAVAFVTSLPELVTDVSAVRRGAPGLALGDIFGSSMANMAILATVTLLFARRRLLQRAALESVLTAMLAMGLTAAAIFFMAAEPRALLGVGIGPAIVAAAYIAGTLVIRQRQSAAAQREEQEEAEKTAREISLPVAQAGFFVAAAVILFSGPLLARAADGLAESTGTGDTFFGLLALALVTSLPELAVSLSALRIGANNLAIANLLGSNATNMALLLPIDLAYEGNLLLAGGQGAEVAAAAAIVLMSIGVSAIVFKAERGRLPVDLSAVVMVAAYVFSLLAVYDASH